MSLETLLPILQSNDEPLPAAELVKLSGIQGDDLERLLDTWRHTSIQRRRNIIDRLADLAEDDVELDFNRIFLAALFDTDVQVRADSIRALWEYDAEELVPVLLQLVRDPEAIVRSEAALGLGRFLLRAELYGDEDARVREIEDALRAALHDDAEIPEVRGRALEALGCRSHDWITDEIERAYTDGERRMQISAVHAMGRNADTAWLPSIIHEMQSDDAEMRFEAATAAGGIGDEEAIPGLAPLTRDEDAEVQEAAIAALGEIGGPAARSILQQVAADSDDSRILEAVSDALAAADFVEDPMGIKVHLERSVAEDMEEEDWEAQDFEVDD